MRLSNTIFLLLIVFILIVTIIIFNKSRVKEKVTLFSNLSSHEIKEFSLTYSGQKLNFKRSDENSIQWQIFKPLQDRADSEKINKFLEKLINSRIIKSFTKDKLSVKSAHLDNNKRISVNLIDNFNKRRKLYLSFRVSMARTCYGMLQDEFGRKSKIYLLGFDIERLLPKNFFDLREKKLIKIDKNQIAHINLRYGEKEIQLKKDNGNWHFVKPLITKANNQQISKFLDKLANIEILEFLSVQEALRANIRFSSKAPQINLRESAQNDTEGENIYFQTEKNNKNICLAKVDKRSGIMKIKADFSKLTNLNYQQYRSKSLFKIKNEQNQAILIERFPKNEQNFLFFIKKNQNWHIQINQFLQRAENKLINKLIKNLNSNIIIEFVTDSALDVNKYGFHNPSLKITILKNLQKEQIEQIDNKNIFLETAKKIQNRHQKKQIFFVLDDSKNTYANPSGTPFISKIDEKFIPSLNIMQINWKALQVLDYLPSEYEKIQINQKNKILEFEQDFASGNWQLIPTEKIKEKEIEQEKFSSFIEILSQLNAKKWLYPNNKLISEFNKKKHLTIKIIVNPINAAVEQTPQMKEIIKIEILQMPNTQIFYGRTNKSENIFLISERTAKILSQKLIN